MKPEITIHLNSFRHLLKVLEDSPRFLFMGFRFQICGKEDGEPFMKNNSGEISKDKDGKIQVHCDGRDYSFTEWLDCNDYDEAEIDSIDIFNIEMCDSTERENKSMEV